MAPKVKRPKKQKAAPATTLSVNIPMMKKKKRSVPTLEEKLAVLELLRTGMSTSSVARKYGRNESSIRAIKIREKEIRLSVTSSAPTTARMTSRVRDQTLVKAENALILWLDDMARKGMAVDGPMLKEKALSVYALFKAPEEEGGSNLKDFKASKGWLHSFKNRFNLKNVNTSEDASSDERAAKMYTKQLKKLIVEKGYVAEQVFNADKVGLFWKKMPERTFISKYESQALGFKASKDRVNLLFCGNAAGHLIKPGLIYRAANPRALKGKNKNLLPVFWQTNRKGSVTPTLFLDWFHKCFIPEVKQYLDEKKLEFKVLLIIDSVGHPEALQFAHGNVQVSFLPLNTSSILQPLDQGVVRSFKAKYTRLMFARIHSAMDVDPDLNVMECWNSFNIADCITFIKQAMDEIRPEAINGCWQNVWKECLKSIVGFPTIDQEVESIVQMAKQIGGPGFNDMIEEEVEALIEEHKDTWVNEELDLEELIKSTIGDEEGEDEQEEPASWNLDKLAQVLQAAKHLSNLICEYDPSMEQSLKINGGITDHLRPYQEMFDQLKKQQRQQVLQQVREHSQHVLQEKATTTNDVEPQPIVTWVDVNFWRPSQ